MLLCHEISIVIAILTKLTTPLNIVFSFFNRTPCLITRNIFTNYTKVIINATDHLNKLGIYVFGQRFRPSHQFSSYKKSFHHNNKLPKKVKDLPSTLFQM